MTYYGKREKSHNLILPKTPPPPHTHTINSLWGSPCIHAATCVTLATVDHKKRREPGGISISSLSIQELVPQKNLNFQFIQTCAARLYNIVPKLSSSSHTITIISMTLPSSPLPFQAVCYSNDQNQNRTWE